MIAVHSRRVVNSSTFHHRVLRHPLVKAYIGDPISCVDGWSRPGRQLHCKFDFTTYLLVRDGYLQPSACRQQPSACHQQNNNCKNYDNYSNCHNCHNCKLTRYFQILNKLNEDCVSQVLRARHQLDYYCCDL